MDMNQDYQDKIDQYLLGKMLDDECLVFERDIENKPDLKEQFEFTKKVKDAIVGRNRRLSLIQEWEQAYNAKKKVSASLDEYKATGTGYNYGTIINVQDESKTHSSKRHYLFWISGIAAILIVGFFIFSPVTFITEENHSHPVYVNYNSLRGGEDYIKIAVSINEGNYNSALVIIDEKTKELETKKINTEQEKDNLDSEEYLYLQEIYVIQADELHLLKAYAFIGLNRSREAMTILDGLRKKDSAFKIQADSLYNLYK